jgi:hypothetical protein
MTKIFFPLRMNEEVQWKQTEDGDEVMAKVVAARLNLNRCD